MVCLWMCFHSEFLFFCLLSEEYAPYKTRSNNASESSYSGTGQYLEFRVANNAEYRPNVEVLDEELQESFIVNLMKECWSHLPEDRPTFERILEVFEEERVRLEKEEGGLVVYVRRLTDKSEEAEDLMLKRKSMEDLRRIIEEKYEEELQEANTTCVIHFQHENGQFIELLDSKMVRRYVRSESVLLVIFYGGKHNPQETGNAEGEKLVDEGVWHGEEGIAAAKKGVKTLKREELREEFMATHIAEENARRLSLTAEHSAAEEMVGQHTDKAAAVSHFSALKSEVQQKIAEIES